MVLLPVIAFFAVLLAVVFRRHPDAAGRARALRRLALGLTVVYVIFIGAFIVGETFADPGGWEAVGLVALWVVPLAGLGLLGWKWPDRARVPLMAVTAAVVAVNVWYTFDTQHWRTFENAHGPVRGVAAFALGAALSAYAYRRPLPGGVLLLVVGVIPVALSMLATGGLGMSSFGALASPAVLVGLLYLGSSTVHGTTSAPPGRGASPKGSTRAPAGLLGHRRGS